MAYFVHYVIEQDLAIFEGIVCGFATASLLLCQIKYLGGV